MKKIICTLLTILVVFGFIGCTKINDKGQFKLAYNFNTLEELVTVTSDIVKCKVTGVPEKISYKGVEFLKVKIKVEDVLRTNNNLSKGNELTILQTDHDEKASLDKNKDLILFIEKYDGPILDDAYVIIGAKYGQLELKENKLYTSVKKDENFYKEIDSNKDLSKLKDMIENKKYVSPKNGKKTDEEIKNNNEKEKQMLENKKENKGNN